MRCIPHYVPHYLLHSVAMVILQGSSFHQALFSQHSEMWFQLTSACIEVSNGLHSLSISSLGGWLIDYILNHIQTCPSRQKEKKKNLVIHHTITFWCHISSETTEGVLLSSRLLLIIIIIIIIIVYSGRID